MVNIMVDGDFEMALDYIQFGCGFSAPLTWRNFDSSPTLRMRRSFFLRFLTSAPRFPKWPTNVEYGDIIRGLPIQESSAKAIYCSHVLEHLSLEDFRLALKNVYTYLIPGGTFRLVVPDLEFYVKKYVQSNEPDAAIQFMENTLLGKKRRAKGIEGLLRSSFGNSAHLWMWDFKSMSNELVAAGFKNIRRANFNDSSDERFRDVEDKGRWDGNLGVECVR